MDLMIAFEALVFEGEFSATKRQTIAIAVSMLIGENEKERKRIKSNLMEGYSLRNTLIHSLKKKKKDIKENQILEFRNYFRRSIKKILFFNS
ncbi:MAG: hypothetical protein O2V44_01975 [Candidatus Bathyarchaeota archaeon]|nr:hypothetical protein [Candidatus Bathyarchaeota archaeon]